MLTSYWQWYQYWALVIGWIKMLIKLGTTDNMSPKMEQDFVNLNPKYTRLWLIKACNFGIFLWISMQRFLPHQIFYWPHFNNDHIFVTHPLLQCSVTPPLFICSLLFPFHRVYALSILQPSPPPHIPKKMIMPLLLDNL